MLKKYYKITIDLEGKNFCALYLDWNYKHGYIDISIPNYIQEKLKKFRHKNLNGYTMHHINGSNQHTIIVKLDMIHHLVQVIIFQLPESLESNPSMILFCITGIQLIQQF